MRTLDGDPRVFTERAAVPADARRGRGGSPCARRAAAHSAPRRPVRCTWLPADRCGDQAVNHPKYETKAHLLSFGVLQSRKSRRKREAQGIDTKATPIRTTRPTPSCMHACAPTSTRWPPASLGRSRHFTLLSSPRTVCARNIGHAALTELGHYEEGGELLVADDLRRTSYASYT